MIEESGQENEQDYVQHYGGHGNRGPNDAKHQDVYPLIRQIQPLSVVQKPLDAQVEDAWPQRSHIVFIPIALECLLGANA